MCPQGFTEWVFVGSGQGSVLKTWRRYCCSTAAWNFKSSSLYGWLSRFVRGLQPARPKGTWRDSSGWAEDQSIDLPAKKTRKKKQQNVRKITPLEVSSQNLHGSSKKVSLYQSCCHLGAQILAAAKVSTSAREDDGDEDIAKKAALQPNTLTKTTNPLP